MTISYFDTIPSTLIEVTAFGFKKDTKQGRLESYPKRMVYDGREYTFIETGMRYLVHKGQEIIRLFDVSDGINSFRLRNAGSNWTMVQMRAL